MGAEASSEERLQSEGRRGYGISTSSIFMFSKRAMLADVFDSPAALFMDLCVGSG